MQQSRQQSQRFHQLAVADPLLETTVAGLVWRILLRQLTPLRSGSQDPQHTIQHGTRVVPGTTPPHT